MIFTRRFSRAGPFFKKFLLSYIVILGFSFVLLMMIYFRFCASLKESSIRSYQSMLQQSADILDQDLAEIDSLHYNLATNSQVAKVINSNTIYQREQFRELKKVYDLMPPLTQKVDNSYLIIPRQDIVISSQSTYPYQRFYDYFIKSQEITPEFWESIVTQNRFNYIIGGVEEDGELHRYSSVYCIQTLPVGERSPRATLLTVIPGRRLEEIFRWTEDQACEVYVLDTHGNLVYSNMSSFADVPDDLLQGAGSGCEEQGNRLYAYTVTQTASLRLVTAAPTSQVLAPVNRLQYQLLLLYLLFMVLGFVLALLFSYNSSRPLEEIVDMIQDHFTGGHPGGGVNSLHAVISDLLVNDGRAKRLLERNLPYIRQEQRKRLLMGEQILHSSDVPETLENITGNAFNVLAIEIIGLPGADSLHTLLEVNVVKGLLRDQERPYGEIRSYFVDLSDNLCAMIIASDEASDAINTRRLEQYAQEIFVQITHESGVMLKFAAGEFHPSLSDVYYSYIAARELLDTGILESNKTIIWGVPQMQEFSYYFPLQIEQRLLATTSSSNQEETKKLLQMVYEQNFVQHRIPERMITRLYDELNGVLYKLLAQLHESMELVDIRQVSHNVKELKKYGNIMTPEQMFVAYQDTFLYICLQLKPKQKAKNVEMRSRITRFMEDSYNDPDLSLTVLAEKFGFSEIYMSQMFKENMGVPFSEYLERLRIDSACFLLKNSTFTISEISQKAGYNSPHAFRRAFKRVTGTLPTELRAAR